MGGLKNDKPAILDKMMPNFSRDNLQKSRKILQSPLRLLIILSVLVFCFEFLVMYIVSFFSHPFRIHAFLDSTLLLLFVFPLLYMLSFRPLIIHINDRKRAVEEKEKLQAQLSTAVDIAHLGYWEHDVVNDLFTYNDHLYRIFRTTVEKIGGYTMSSAEYLQRFVHPDDISLVKEEMRESLEEKTPNASRQMEHRILYDDGSIGYISVQVYFIRSAQGQILKSYGVSQDITDRKHAEEVLMKEKDNLQKALDEIKILRGILPICSHCKKIRDDKGFWKPIESYISDHSEAEFSHGICQECAEKFYPDMDLHGDA